MSYKKAFFALVTLILLVAGGVALFVSNPQNNNLTPAPIPGKQGAALDYSNQSLSHFPKDALNQTNTTALDLSHNKLSGSLPAEIKNLSKLQVLDVSYNQMTGIPAEIGQLKTLTTLNYSYNQLTGLPLELGNLTELKVLDFRGNPGISQHDLGLIRPKLPNTQIKL